ncbi:MAG TPA: FAD:protein FMN transferase, partial [Membranihabitans sp.]|nr:FAD:protein FMN transferase [Membranihabitans sp.]
MIIGCKYWGIWIILLSMILQRCQGQDQVGETGMQKLSGATMGTTWHLTYEGTIADVAQPQIEEVLKSINLAASTYISESIISRLNKGEIVDIGQEDPNQVEFFRYNIEICDSVWRWSNGFFDPTVMPLVNYWGFGYTGHRPIEEVDSATIDSLLRYVGFDQVADRFGGAIWEMPPGFQLDFSAVAKGAASDWVGKFMEDQGITNYLIEIGGEIVAKGPGRTGDGWVVGISKPEINAPARDLIEYLSMKDRGLATSGNYRNY